MYYLVNNEGNYSVVEKKEWKKILEKNKKAKAIKYTDRDLAMKALYNIVRTRKELSNGNENLDRTVAGLVCFYDSEFNSFNYICNKPNEVVSIGIAVMDTDGEIVDQYYSTCKTKAVRKISKHCQKITRLDPAEIQQSKSFPDVCSEVYDFLSKYRIKTIYALGQDDKKQFDATMALYESTSQMSYISKRLINIRGALSKMVGNDIGNFGLASLKSLCELDDNVKHNALADAVDLANVYYRLKTHGYSEKAYQKVLKEREAQRIYKSSRNITETNVPKASADVCEAKETVVKYLEQVKVNVHPMVLKAMIDDLNTLIK